MAKKNTLTEETIPNLIYTIRNTQVILDEDIAKLYSVTTGHLNEKVKRNIDRFDYDFMFQLTSEEFAILKSQIAISSWGGRRKLPFAFTELGVAMLSSILTSKEAIEVNKQIMRAFSAMRRFLVSNAQVFQRLDNLEYKCSLPYREGYTRMFNFSLVSKIVNCIYKCKYEMPGRRRV